MDDILIFGKIQAEHDQHLEAVLKRIQDANGTLSWPKCEFSKTKLTFLGHVIDADGIRADPTKTEAIVKMSPPTNTTELRRFLGMANQLGKFTPKLALVTHQSASAMVDVLCTKWSFEKTRLLVAQKEFLGLIMYKYTVYIVVCS